MSAIKRRNNVVKPNRRAEPRELSDPGIEMLRKRAYELFLARGAAHGADLSDWFQAERDLRTASQR
jgi:hypothetical protein